LYTGNAAGLIGMLDPKTEKIAEYKMPDRQRATRTRRSSDAMDCSLHRPGRQLRGPADPVTGAVTLKQPRQPTAVRGIAGEIRILLFRRVQFQPHRAARSQNDGDRSSATECRGRPRRVAMGIDDSVYYRLGRGFLGA
jgi:hypothetical protein